LVIGLPSQRVAAAPLSGTRDPCRSVLRIRKAAEPGAAHNWLIWAIVCLFVAAARATFCTDPSVGDGIETSTDATPSGRVEEVTLLIRHLSLSSHQKLIDLIDQCVLRAA
jgi:hypothetical protein